MKLDPAAAATFVRGLISLKRAGRTDLVSERLEELPPEHLRYLLGLFIAAE